MQKIILISLLILVASINRVIEFGKEIPFDKNNNEFEFTSEENGAVFIYIIFGASNILKLNLKNNDGTESLYSSVNNPGVSIIRSISNGYTYTINLEYSNPNSEEKGIIWLNPSSNEIKVDLNKIYEWKFDCASIIGIESSLVYTIDNAEKSATFVFKYNNMKLEDGSTAQNPFEVCHGEECKEDITTYDFEKGESYKIYAKVYKKKINVIDTYILPSFSFYDKANEKENYSFNLRLNLWIISLLLFII